MNVEDLNPQQTPEQSAAEEAAFTSAFSAEVGKTPESVAAQEITPVVAPAAAIEETPPATPATPAGAETPPATPAVPLPVLAGLTEDQIAQALARVSQQQGTIDKLGGRLGQLMQQVEALKAVPRTVSEQTSFDLKLERLTAAFPELAEVLREDLKGLGGSGVGTGTVPAVPAAPSFTEEDVNRIVTEKLGAFKQQQEIGLEVRMLGTVHPDWETVIRTPQFALWRDNVIADGTELMQSENAAFISRKLTEFKDWAKATSTPAAAVPPATAAAPPPAAPPPAPARSQRLLQAVMPEGNAPPPAGIVSEEDAFTAAFNKERSRTGR